MVLRSEHPATHARTARHERCWRPGSARLDDGRRSAVGRLAQVPPRNLGRSEELHGCGSSRPRHPAAARRRTHGVGTDADLSSEPAAASASGGESEWFDTWHGPMLAVVRRSVDRTLADASAAEETVQEVMLEIWLKSRRGGPDRRCPEAWATTIARRRAIDRGRADHSRSRRERLVLERRQDQVELVSEDVMVRFDREQVVTALAVVNDKQREAIVLAYFGDHTYAEVARLLGIPLGTVKQRIRDGMARMRPVLSPTLV